MSFDVLARVGLIATLTAVSVFAAFGQDGFVDPDISFTVNDVVLQPDGKIVVAGRFATVAGQARSRVARLNANGSLDPTFQDPLISSNDPGNLTVFAIARQSDGKIVIGGLFTDVGGQPRNAIARLNGDGSLDSTFAPSVNSSVTAIAIQTDGKLVIGGYFTTVNGQPRTRLARINPDGSLDSGFIDPQVVPTPFANAISTVAVQTDGRILIGGYIASVGGQSRTYLARLNSDGSPDAAFAPTLGGPVNQILIRNDGKILIGGPFGTINGTPRSLVARLESNGSLDPGFQITVIPSGSFGAMALQADGKLIVGGSFTADVGREQRNIARFNADGGFDPLFADPNANFGGNFFGFGAIVVQPDSKILIGGDFNTIGFQSRKNAVRLNADGTVDRAPAQTLTVTKTADTNDGACNADCSLREAFAAANADPDGGRIIFDPVVFANSQTITLGLGELVASRNRRVIVAGAGASQLTVSGNNASRILRIERDAEVSISGVRFADGNASSGGAIYIEPNGVITKLALTNAILANNSALQGGAIGTLGQSAVTVSASTITGNSASNNLGGGGIYFDNGTLTVSNSTISSNVASFGTAAGGIGIGNNQAVFNISDSTVLGNTGTGIGAGGTTTIANSTISSNQANGIAGGVYVGGNVTIRNSQITGNFGNGSNALGGGIANFGTMTISDSTIGGNSAAFGAGIYTAGGMTATNIQVLNNVASGSGGGVYNNAGGNSPATFVSSRIAGNAAAQAGGGFYNRDLLIVNSSTIESNTAGLGGGGLFNVFLNVGAATSTVAASTFSANTTGGSGAGVQNQEGTVNLFYVTLSGNTANGFGGAINTNLAGIVNATNVTAAFNLGRAGAGGFSNNQSTLKARNCLVARNRTTNRASGPDIAGTIQSSGFNLIGNTNGGNVTGLNGDKLNVNPQIRPLAANGGPTKTHALAATSPAIDGGSRVSGATSDQRGLPGSIDLPGVPNTAGGDGSDIGSFEVQANESFPGYAPFDFDGDGRTDIAIFRPSNGQWWIANSSLGTIAHTFGAATDRLVPGDFTGDGVADVAIWRPASGEWFVMRSEDYSYYSFPFGAVGDIPAPGDFDGDGVTDAAVFRPADSTWYVQRSSGGTTIEAFGSPGDLPVASDYDGDGVTDIAIYRPSSGQWWLKRSTEGVIAVTFGVSTDRCVPGDYTGDGKSDVAIFRPSTGQWMILRSEDFSFYAFPFGNSTDAPAPGDYDGDGRIDAAVFRSSVSTWYVQRSTAGPLIQSFGVPTDLAVPNAFVR